MEVRSEDMDTQPETLRALELSTIDRGKIRGKKKVLPRSH